MIDRFGLEQIDPEGVPDGTYAVTVLNGTIVSLDPIPAAGVQTLTAGLYATVDDTDPLNVIVGTLTPTTTFVGGVWELVFDSNGQIVYSEAP